MAMRKAGQRQYLCGVCLEERGRIGGRPGQPFHHASCEELLPPSGTKLITPVWPVVRASKEEARLLPYLNRLMSTLPRELICLILRECAPFSKEHILEAFKERLLPRLSGGCVAHETADGIAYLHGLAKYEYDGHQFLAQGQEADSDIDHAKLPRFLILIYDDANCTHIEWANEYRDVRFTATGRWFRVRHAQTLSERCNVVSKV